MGDAAAYAYIAMQDAIADAGLEESEVSNERTSATAPISMTTRISNVVIRTTPLWLRGWACFMVMTA